MTDPYQSCEKIRVALEGFEPEKDMENFVRDYSTGNSMPDPPQFVNYANPDAIPASSSRPTSRPANFVRSSNRSNQPRSDFIPPPEEEPSPSDNVAGLGSGRRNSVSVPDQPINGFSGQRQANGYGPGGSSQSSVSGPSAGGDPASPQMMLRTGDQPHPNKPDPDPQTLKPGHSPGGPKVGQENDPLAKQMAELRNASAGGRRNSFVQKEQQQESGPPKARDYSTSADIVVGGFPSHSRPVSPNQPTAALMRPPANSAPSPNVTVDTVLADYHQSLPGEGKSHSRSASRQSHFGPAQLLERPASREGFAGIGSHGRSPSPAFNGNGQRNASPIPPHQGSISRPSTTSNATSGHTARQDSVNIPQQKLPNRATTPNSVGISLDTKGNVAIDSMADVYQPQHNQTASQPSQQYHIPPQNQQSTGFQRRLSTSHSNGSVNIAGQQPHIPPQTQPPYGAPPPAPYPQPPPTQPPPPQQQPHYIQPPAQQPPPINYHYPPQPDYAQPPAHSYTQAQQGLNRVQSVSSPYYQQAIQQQQPQQIINGYRSASPQPLHNQPVQAQPHGITAAPTGQYTEAGRPVLFYGMFQKSSFESVS